MTKKEEETTKNRLTWRLSELPTANEVAGLVDSGILSVEEARQILIKEEVPKSDREEIEALKEMVRTLQEMVKDLLARPTAVPYTKVIEIQPRYKPYWDSTFLNSPLTRSPNVVLTATTLDGSKNAGYNLSNIT